MNWTDIELFDEDDPKKFEPVLTDGLETTISGLIDEVKEHIEAELRNRFKQLQDDIAVSSADFDILDHIENPTRLNRPAVFYCLYLLFYGQRVGAEGEYAKKADEYRARYERAFEDACIMLKFDSDVENYGFDYGEVIFKV
jgi:hypothetical protein